MPREFKQFRVRGKLLPAWMTRKNPAAKVATKVAKKRPLKLYADCIYRSHVDSKKMFGPDVSFCYGRYANPSHYLTVAFSEFAEGSYMFELTFLKGPEMTMTKAKPIGEHHPGAWRGRLMLEDKNLNISRIFYDSGIDSLTLLKDANFFQLKQPEYEITWVKIDREALMEGMFSSSSPSIRLKPLHPDHELEEEVKGVADLHVSPTFNLFRMPPREKCKAGGAAAAPAAPPEAAATAPVVTLGSAPAPAFTGPGGRRG